MSLVFDFLQKRIGTTPLEHKTGLIPIMQSFSIGKKVLGKGASIKTKLDFTFGIKL